MRFIDTNIFLRVLTRDDPAKAADCEALLHRIEAGVEQAFTTEAAIVEVMFVLMSPRQYGLARAEVAHRVAALLAIRNLQVAGRVEIARACELFVVYPRLDLADALAVAHMEREGVSELYGYDRDFDGVPGVTRLEPA